MVVPVAWLRTVGVCLCFWILAGAGFPGPSGDGSGSAGEGLIPFESDRWDKSAARLVSYLDRACLVGQAMLRDVDFTDGVIEVDLAVTGVASYPGICFRRQAGDTYEHVYVRPHRAGRYPDALQYTPVFHGLGSWQLYSGEGFTAGVEMPPNRWVRLKVEVRGEQARVYLGDGPDPALVIPELKLDAGRGQIGVLGGREGVAYFSNFRFRPAAGPAFPPPGRKDPSPGLFTQWQLSQPLPLGRIDLARYPLAQPLPALAWREAAAGPDGLVDIGRVMPRTGGEPDCVLARTTVQAPEDRLLKLQFGYSDLGAVFCNGQPGFQGDSSYRSRDPSFLGVVGLWDAVYLPLRKGSNELLLAVAEAMGGWGFVCRDGQAEFRNGRLGPLWESGPEFRMPESVVFDPAGKMFYVSNYDGYSQGSGARQSSSRVSPEGRLVQLEWASGLANPTGLAVRGDRLYAVERGGVAEIALSSGEVTRRLPLPNPRFPNDIALDEDGRIYVSDSGRNAVCRWDGHQWEDWLQGGELQAPNGLCLLGNRLLVGCSGSHSLCEVDLATRATRTLARFDSGTVDGIRPDGAGGCLVSLWEGRLYRVSPDGSITRLLDRTPAPVHLADFEYVPAAGLLVIPTFEGNRLAAYRLAPE